MLKIIASRVVADCIEARRTAAARGVRDDVISNDFIEILAKIHVLQLQKHFKIPANLDPQCIALYVRSQLPPFSPSN